MTDAHLVAHHVGLKQEPPLGAHLATRSSGASRQPPRVALFA